MMALYRHEIFISYVYIYIKHTVIYIYNCVYIYIYLFINSYYLKHSLFLHAMLPHLHLDPTGNCQITKRNFTSLKSQITVELESQEVCS
jgi:hypothetical protein